jgi:hypothetical protein
MSPWQIAQYPIAFCVTIIVICITISFLHLLLYNTRNEIHSSEEKYDDDEDNLEWFVEIKTEDAFKMTEDGEYPKIYIRKTAKAK